jgi:hypothetical protein
MKYKIRTEQKVRKLNKKLQRFYEIESDSDVEE